MGSGRIATTRNEEMVREVIERDRSARRNRSATVIELGSCRYCGRMKPKDLSPCDGCGANQTW